MNEITQAITILNQGGIIIFPTDTAFGIGCRLDKPESIERLFSLRKRPPQKATPVLVGSIGMAEDYLQPLTNDVWELMQKYWPGALTIIYSARIDQSPLLVRGGGDTLGLRMPNHQVVLEIIRQLDVPILGPSANFHGDPTPFSYSELDGELVKLVDFVVPGKCTIKQASTVIDCSIIPWQIKRQGAVTVKELHNV